jgi:GMP synthase (glutamine-hydrolysing)
MASKLCAPSLVVELNREQAANLGGRHLILPAPCSLFEGFWQVGGQHTVWMSHGDHVAKLPDGFSVVATSAGAPFAAVADESRHYYGVQFHPEVVHTQNGA